MIFNSLALGVPGSAAMYSGIMFACALITVGCVYKFTHEREREHHESDHSFFYYALWFIVTIGSSFGAIISAPLALTYTIKWMTS